MRRVVFVFSLFALFHVTRGQDIPYVHSVDQYLNNGMIINPAYAGSRDVLSGTLMHRSQWLGFDGAPISEIFAVHTPLKNEKIGLGLMVDNFSIPTVQYNSLYFNYAYRMWLGSSRLSLGLKAGGYFYKETLADLNLKEPDAAFENPRSGFAPNFGFGAYLYNTKYILGLAIPFLMSQSDTATFGFDLANYHYILTAGYLFDFSPNFKIKPAVLVDYNKYYLTYQIANHFILFNDALWLGAAYKSNKDLTFMLEVQLNTALKIGYAYDHSFSEIAKFSNGSHEIMLRYELRYKANVDNPFYF
ncbi:MAG: type IX secretion system membrane protein PorP/SprF [Bacteroidales bacterium]|nr:type IX secretion system membrane protein PorP/SprF [Bacteroidales bacterium]MCB9013570.1 type IX secretion system membrane protein PorP/SprF [Bacteroidales bacterium]